MLTQNRRIAIYLRSISLEALGEEVLNGEPLSELKYIATESSRSLRIQVSVYRTNLRTTLCGVNGVLLSDSSWYQLVTLRW